MKLYDEIIETTNREEMENLFSEFTSKIQSSLVQVTDRQTRKHLTLTTIPASFDIETTTTFKRNKKNECVDKHAWMYCWQFGLDGHCILGRTWDEFGEFMGRLEEILDAVGAEMIVLDCNLGYEFQFFRKYIAWDEVWTIKGRDVVEAKSSHFIFRDTMTYTGGMGLSNTAKELHRHNIQKLKGDIDYTLTRHSETPLTEKEKGYCRNDVLILNAYECEQIEDNGIEYLYNIKTNTQKVREDVRKYCFEQDAGYQKRIKQMKMDFDVYKNLFGDKGAYHGGFTHANHNWTHIVEFDEDGNIVNERNRCIHNVDSFDFTSSYPTTMLSEKFPMSTFQPISMVRNEEELVQLMKDKCVLFTAHFTGITCNHDFENFISLSKCLDISTCHMEDNGRIVWADYLTMRMTEVDWEVFNHAYTWDDVEFSDVYIAEKSYLPRVFLEKVLYYYSQKTLLKGIEDEKTKYQILKGMLNGLYGMCCSNPLRSDIEYTETEHFEETKVDIYTDDEDTITDYQTKLNKLNNSKTRFLFSAWGVWVSAYAFRNLYKGIVEFGNDYIYSDTDSIKCKNADKHMKFIEDYNKDIRRKIKECCDTVGLDFNQADAPDKDGNRHMLGEWDWETKDAQYLKFATLGAKRYIYTTLNKEGVETLHITVAGLDKKAGAEFLAKDGIETAFDQFVDGLEIPEEHTNKMIHTYIDEEYDDDVTDYTGKTAHVNQLSSVALTPTAFNLSLSLNYSSYLLCMLRGVTIDADELC